jgi:hypothetical protein
MDTASKKQLHHAWRYIRPIKPLYLGIALLVIVSATVLALRINYQTMVTLRQSVYVADERNGDVEAALRDLRTYVYSHMNTDLTAGNNSVRPPIQLKYTYDRLVAAEQERVKAVNETIYSDAQAYCEAKYPQSFSGGPRVPCIQEYISSNGVQPQSIPDGLYKFDFVSPSWSPDAAGLLLILSAITALALVVRVMFPLILRRYNAL